VSTEPKQSDDDRQCWKLVKKEALRAGVQSNWIWHNAQNRDPHACRLHIELLRVAVDRAERALLEVLGFGPPAS
jgi:hypothetical protein